MNRKHLLITTFICFVCIYNAQVNKPLSTHQNTLSNNAIAQIETPLDAGILANTFPTQIDSSFLARTIVTHIDPKDLEKMNEVWLEEKKQLRSKPEDTSTPKKK